MRQTRILAHAALFWLASCSINTQDNSSRSPAIPGIRVPDGYSVELAAGPELVDFPMFATLDEAGRLFVFESTGNVYSETKDALENPQFRIKLLEDEDGDGIFDKSTIFADSVGFPQGGVFYQGSLYATSAPDLLKFTDTNSDGVADLREIILTGWVLNVNANSLIGPFMGPDGWLYMTSAITGFDVTTLEGERLKGETSRIWRVRPDGSGLEWISAGGMNNPVELTFTEAGEPIGTETYFTNPKAGQRDALVYWTEGGVYPKPNPKIDRDKLVRTGELMPVVTKYSRVAPSGIGRYRSTAFGDDFKDNLFSAQFNTHRVIRHKVFREGASFRTEDEVFLSLENDDFHPTDVLEDADGSLLVVETGGWFIKGCPLSQVSKPELKGSIYRVRKNGSRVSDSYGNGIDWPSLSPSRLVKYSEDPRPFVRDRAIETLISLPATEPLVDLMTSSSEEIRTRAVFALYRTGTESARQSVRKALSDRHEQVRVAAARASGLARDKEAVRRLIELVETDEPAVRRQAAVALAQIGDPGAVSTLLSASETAIDRFVEHAIIYALIELNQPEQVVAALQHPSARVRRTALVTLDQISPSPLKSEQVIASLESDNAELRGTALWIASHHPEWSGDFSSFLKKRLLNESLTDEEKQLFGAALVSFCNDLAIQNFIAEQLQTNTKQKPFLLKVMGECRQEGFPVVWTNQLKRILTSATDADVLGSALELIRRRGIASLSGDLKKFAARADRPVLLRLDALAAFVDANPKLSAGQFEFLYAQLAPGNDAPVRLKAASVLAQGKVSEAQLLRLAKDYLPGADAFILPRLVPAFAGTHSAEIGIALANALMNSRSLDSYSEENLKAIFEQYPNGVKPTVDQLVAKLKNVHAERLERIRALESRIPNGVLENGRALFFGKAVCWTCHTVGSEGGTLGPDLTSIQKDRSPHDLLEAIIYPSLSFVREYETYRVTTRQTQHTGIIRSQSPTEVLLATDPQTSVLIPREDIEKMEVLDVSVMPQGLDKILTDQEMADLMAFLIGQDQNPKTDERILRNTGSGNDESHSKQSARNRNTP